MASIVLNFVATESGCCCSCCSIHSFRLHKKITCLLTSLINAAVGHLPDRTDFLPEIALVLHLAPVQVLIGLIYVFPNDVQAGPCQDLVRALILTNIGLLRRFWLHREALYRLGIYARLMQVQNQRMQILLLCLVHRRMQILLLCQVHRRMQILLL